VLTRKPQQWACESLRELTEEMEMWKWDSTLDNRWARVPQCSFLFLKEQLKSIIIINKIKNELLFNI
jgi:hypothetical protein